MPGWHVRRPPDRWSEPVAHGLLEHRSDDGLPAHGVGLAIGVLDVAEAEQLREVRVGLPEVKPEQRIVVVEQLLVPVRPERHVQHVVRERFGFRAAAGSWSGR